MFTHFQVSKVTGRITLMDLGQCPRCDRQAVEANAVTGMDSADTYRTLGFIECPLIVLNDIIIVDNDSGLVGCEGCDGLSIDGELPNGDDDGTSLDDDSDTMVIGQG